MENNLRILDQKFDWWFYPPNYVIQWDIHRVLEFQNKYVKVKSQTHNVKYYV